MLPDNAVTALVWCCAFILGALIVTEFAPPPTPWGLWIRRIFILLALVMVIVAAIKADAV